MANLRKTPVVLFFGILIPAFAAIATDQASPETLFGEYRKGVKVIEEKFDHCRGEGNFSSFKIPKDNSKRSETKAKISFAFAPGKGIEIRSPVPWKEPQANPDPTKKAGGVINYQTILGYNDKYSFNLGKSTPNAGPVIELFEPGDKRGRSQISNSAGYLALSPISNHFARMSDFLHVEGFRIDRVVEDKSPTESRRMRFEFSIPKKSDLPKNARPVVSGWFVVAPDDGWLVHEYGNIHAAPTSGQKIYTYVGHVNYQKNSRGHLVPSKADVRLYLGVYDSDPATMNPPVASNLGEDFEFTKFEFTDPPASDFTLSGFGLPEYGQTVAQVSATRSRPWWIVGLAVLSGGVALGLRRLATRNRVAKVGGNLGSGTPSTPGAT